MIASWHWECQFKFKKHIKLKNTVKIIIVFLVLCLSIANIASANKNATKKDTLLWSLYEKAKSFKSEPDSAQLFLDSCFTYKELKADEELFALCNLHQANLHVNNDNFIEAAINVQLCKGYFVKSNNKLKYAKCQEISGLCKTNSGDYKGSIEDLSIAGAIFDSLNLKSDFYNVQNEIGNNFFYLQNIKYAKNKFEEVYEYAIQIKDTQMISYLLNNLANIYSTSEMLDFDKALSYYRKAIKISELNLDFENAIVFRMNIAILFDENGNTDSALYYYHSALNILKKQESIRNLIWVMYNLGYMHFALNNFDSANYYLGISLDNALETGFKSIISEIYNTKAQLYSKQKQYKKAFNASQKALNLKDSIWRDDITNSTVEIEAKYSLQKKLNEIKLQKTQIELQETQLYSQKAKNIGLLVAALLLLLVLMGRVFYSKKLKQKNKLLEDRNKLIKQKNSALKETINTRDRLISIIAHDIKNPLATMAGFAELISLSDNKESIDKLKSYGNHILLSANNLFDLLDNLLKWAKKQQDGVELSPNNVNLYNLVESNISLLGLTAKSKNVKLINNCSKKSLAYVDEQTVNTVIRNLISNAIKFTEKGGIISVSAENSEKYSVLHIKDTGIGIKEEDIDKLFNVDIDRNNIGNQNNKGIGLGLILCYDFTTLNNGKINVKSKYGEGSTFSIHLPLPK